MKRAANQLESVIDIQDYILDYSYNKYKNLEQNIIALSVDINNFIVTHKLTECALNIEILAQKESGWKLKAISQALKHNNLIASLTLKGLFTFNSNKAKGDRDTKEDEDIAQHLSSMLEGNNKIKHLTLYTDYSNDNLMIEQSITQGIENNKTIRSLACSPDIHGHIPEYLSNHHSIKFLQLLDCVKDVAEFINSSKRIISLSFRIEEFDEFDCNDTSNAYLNKLKIALQENNNLQQLTLDINNPDLDSEYIINFFSEVLERNHTLEEIIFEGEYSDSIQSDNIENKLLANKEFNNNTVKLICSLDFSLDIAPTKDHLAAFKHSERMGNSLFEEKLKQYMQLDRHYNSIRDKENFEWNDVLKENIFVWENTEGGVNQKIQEINIYCNYYSSHFDSTYIDSQKDLSGLDGIY